MNIRNILTTLICCYSFHQSALGDQFLNLTPITSFRVDEGIESWRPTKEHLFFFRQNPGGELPANLLTKEFILKFKPLDRSSLNFGHTKDRIWLLLKIERQQLNPTDLILELDYADISYVHFFSYSSEGILLGEYSTGINMNSNTKPIPHHTYAFPIPASTNVQYLLIAAEAQISVIMPIIISSEKPSIKPGYQGY